MRVLDRLAVSFLRGRNTGIGHVEELLHLLRGTKLVEIGAQRSRVQILETAFEHYIL